jgi:hypothetical protein
MISDCVPEPVISGRLKLVRSFQLIVLFTPQAFANANYLNGRGLF